MKFSALKITHPRQGKVNIALLGAALSVSIAIFLAPSLEESRPAILLGFQAAFGVYVAALLVALGLRLWPVPETTVAGPINIDHYRVFAERHKERLASWGLPSKLDINMSYTAYATLRRQANKALAKWLLLRQ